MVVAVVSGVTVVVTFTIVTIEVLPIAVILVGSSVVLAISLFCLEGRWCFWLVWLGS